MLCALLCTLTQSYCDAYKCRFVQCLLSFPHNMRHSEHLKPKGAISKSSSCDVDVDDASQRRQRWQQRRRQNVQEKYGKLIFFVALISLAEKRKANGTLRLFCVLAHARYFLTGP